MSASSLSDAFAACLAYDARQPGPAELIGLEHEYRVLCDGRGLDFRELIHHLDIGGRRIDPADTNAYRLASGLALTCDEAEAEIATPPLALAPGFTLELDAWALAGRTQLSSLLPPGHTVEGFSTHLSASFAGRDPNAVINLFSRTFAPVLMPILDGPDSFGIYLRPRPGRIELCGEYVAGDYLRATAAVFAGGVRACASVVEGEVRSWQSLPPTLDIHLRPAQGRFGTYIGRSSAFDYDLYEAGRAAQLPLIAGGTTTLQAQLERAWLAAKACLSDASAADVEVAEAIVEGKTSFRTETGEGAAEAETNKAGLALDREWLGRVLPLRRRPNFTVEAMSATWAFTLFRIVGPTGLAFACLPRGALRSFLQQLDAGTLDGCLLAYLEVQHEGRRLSSPAETMAPGLWDSVADGLQLISPEPDAVTGTFPRAMTGSQFARLETPGTPRAGKLAATPSTFDHVRGRPGKSTDDRRPGKPLVVPARTQIIPSGLPGPFAPEPTAPEEPVVGDLSPTLPAAPSPKPPSPRPRATHYLVPLAGIVVVVIGVVVAAVAGAFTGGASPGLVPAPTTTPTPTATWTPTSTPLPSATAPAVSPPQPSPSRIATTRPTETPIVTPRPTVTTIASATPTRTRTPVLDLTRTSTPCATAGAVCSPTPTRTRTPGAPIN